MNTKQLAPIILVTIILHYVFVAALSTRVSRFKTAALIALVLVGGWFVWVLFLDAEDK